MPEPTELKPLSIEDPEKIASKDFISDEIENPLDASREAKKSLTERISSEKFLKVSYPKDVYTLATGGLIAIAITGIIAIVITACNAQSPEDLIAIAPAAVGYLPGDARRVRVRVVGDSQTQL